MPRWKKRIGKRGHQPMPESPLRNVSVRHGLDSEEVASVYDDLDSDLEELDKYIDEIVARGGLKDLQQRVQADEPLAFSMPKPTTIPLAGWRPAPARPTTLEEDAKSHMAMVGVKIVKDGPFPEPTHEPKRYASDPKGTTFEWDHRGFWVVKFPKCSLGQASDHLTELLDELDLSSEEKDTIVRPILQMAKDREKDDVILARINGTIEMLRQMFGVEDDSTEHSGEVLESS